LAEPVACARTAVLVETNGTATAFTSTPLAAWCQGVRGVVVFSPDQRV